MRLVSSYYELSSSKLKRDYKIVHLSDIHYEKGYSLKRFEILLKQIKEINPDYICITGDLIDTPFSLNDSKDLILFRDFLKELGYISKVIISIGNHEMKGLTPFSFEQYNKVISKFKNISNVVVLSNELYKDDFLFIGYNPPSSYYEKKEEDASILINDFNKMDFPLEDKYCILLIHTPKDLLKDKIYLNIPLLSKMDLILSGHTHGGMVPTFFPGHFGFISPSKKLFPSCVRGKLVRNNTTLIICSAIVRLSNVSGLAKLNDFYAMHINIISLKKQV